MWGKIVGGAIGSLFGPVGTAVGIALGAALESDDDNKVLFTNDALDLQLKVQTDKDGYYLFPEARKPVPSGELAVVANILDRDDKYLKAKRLQAIPSVYSDSDGDFSVATSFSGGSGVLFCPFGVLDYSSSGSYKICIAVVDVSDNDQPALVGREIFNGTLPSPRSWHKCEHLRPLLGLLMVVARSRGELDRETVRRLREFAEGPLEVPEEERNVLKEIIKSEPSEDIETLASYARFRFPGLDGADILKLLLAFSERDGVVDAKEREALRVIADKLGIAQGTVPELDRATKDYYAVLGIAPGASAEEIRRAYRYKLKDYHPDKVATLPKEFQELAHRMSLEIREAYENLKA